MPARVGIGSREQRCSPLALLNRDQLLDFAQGREGGPFERSVDMQVGRLRRRLRDDAKEPRIIKTVRSAGYVLAAAVKKVK